MVRSVLHHREDGQAVADVDAHVRLCRGYFAPVPRPVDAVERKFQRRGVNGKDIALETAYETLLVPDQREVRAKRPEMLEYLPVEVLGNCRIARAVGVGEGVAPGGLAPRIRLSSGSCSLVASQISFRLAARFGMLVQSRPSPVPVPNYLGLRLQRRWTRIAGSHRFMVAS